MLQEITQSSTTTAFLNFKRLPVVIIPGNQCLITVVLNFQALSNGTIVVLKFQAKAPRITGGTTQHETPVGEQPLTQIRFLCTKGPPLNALVVIGENPTSSGGLDPGSPAVSLAVPPKTWRFPFSWTVSPQGFPQRGLEPSSIELVRL